MVHLVPMNETSFQTWLEQEIREYAEEKTKAGHFAAEDALQRSEKEHHDLLPQGLATPDQYLFSAFDPESGVEVGMIWFAVERRGARPFAFIYDIRVFDAYQGRGYGKGIMQALEPEVRALGLDKISLHVFGENQRARALYEKMGYDINDLWMTKNLERNGGETTP